MTIHKQYFGTNIQQLFEHFNHVNVLVVGDVMIDRYLTGKIDRISPEAPVPIVQLNEKNDRLGGAANVAVNIKALGATPYLCSVVGDDEHGQQIVRLLNEKHISSKYICYSRERKTTVKSRILASNQHVLRVDEEDKHDLTQEEHEDFIHVIRELLDQKEIHVILFQDYNKGVLSQDMIQEIMLEAIKQDIPTVVDPKAKNFWQYKRATLFKPNFREVAAKVPFELTPDLDGLNRAASYIKDKLGNQSTMITLSDKGLFIYEKAAKLIPTQPRAIADVCGAGDAVISVVALGVALGVGLEELGVVSNLAGGQVCEKVGVAAVDKAQLVKEYHGLNSPTLS